MSPEEAVTISFPVRQRTEKAVLHGIQYTFQFRGNTVVEIQPRSKPAGCYPMYERDPMKADKTPMKTKNRFLSDAKTRGKGRCLWLPFGNAMTGGPRATDRYRIAVWC